MRKTYLRRTPPAGRVIVKAAAFRAMFHMARLRPFSVLFLILSAIHLFISPAVCVSKEIYELPMEAIIRVEASMHTEMIRRIAVDDANRYLVTASEDKTARVWDLSTGKLLRILRPPIGDINEGKLFAAAITPDGRYTAVGGWIGREWDKVHSIYVFETETGRVKQRIKVLAEVVYNLVYSRDGRYLAVSMGAKGLRVYQTSDYSMVFEDREYKDSSYGADFDQKNRLVTTSIDGFLRLYEPADGAYKLVKMDKAAGGERPYWVSFSPDGQRLAIGFAESPKVDVLSGSTLEHLYYPDTAGYEIGNISKVAWSLDGKRLYAGGRFQKQIKGEWKYMIRRWEEGGRGGYSEFPASDSTIMHIVPLKNGSIAFGSADPSFGVIDSDGRMRLYKGPVTADHTNNLANFITSYDGGVVVFGYRYGGKDLARFSLAERALTSDLSDMAKLRPPATVARGVEVKSWKDSRSPMLNGRPLVLDDRYEMSRCLAVSQDGDHVILGTDWSLKDYYSSGRLRWSIVLHTSVLSVNISGNGKTVVAALGDGTIRWFAIENGKELLAFMPHGDRVRWVAWTPSGYYDASPGAEDLLGWHINNGTEKESDFIPASRFRARHYRPDILAKILQTFDEEAALAAANEFSGREAVPVPPMEKALPPVVTVFSPSGDLETSSEDLTIKFLVKAFTGAEIKRVRVLIDGRNADAKVSELTEPEIAAVEEKSGAEKKGVRKRKRVIRAADRREYTDYVGEAKIKLPKRDAVLSLIAEGNEVVSAPAVVNVSWKAEKVEARPRLVVLSIGTGSYRKGLSLMFPSKDAADFAKVLERQSGGYYSEVIVKVLTDSEITKKAVYDSLKWLKKETRPGDNVMVYLSGHGGDDMIDIYYFLPSNSDFDTFDEFGVDFTVIRNALAELPGKPLLFADIARVAQPLSGRVTDVTYILNDFSSPEYGITVFMATSGLESSIEDQTLENSAFAKAVVEGLGGSAAKNGEITVGSLNAYLSARVAELTRGRQTPTISKPLNVPDFRLAIWPVEKKTEEPVSARNDTAAGEGPREGQAKTGPEKAPLKAVPENRPVQTEKHPGKEAESRPAEADPGKNPAKVRTSTEGGAGEPLPNGK